MANAAFAGLVGQDAWAFVTARSPAERILRMAMLKAAAKHREDIANDLAVRIANAMNGDVD